MANSKNTDSTNDTITVNQSDWTRLVGIAKAHEAAVAKARAKRIASPLPDKQGRGAIEWHVAHPHFAAWLRGQTAEVRAEMLPLMQAAADACRE